MHSFSKPGGVKTHVFGLYKEFKKRGIETKIIAPRRSQEEDYGKDVILLGTSFPIAFGGSKSDLAVNFNTVAIEETLKEEKFDVLHFHNFGFPSTFQILEKSDALNILTFHANIEGSDFLKNFPFLLYFLEKMVKWKIDGIIGVAPLALELFKNYSGPKTVIPNGVDLEIFNPKVRKIKEFRDGKINICFVGRFDKRKGLIYLLKAYKILQRKYKNIRLIIVGDGATEKEYQEWAKINDLKEVHFVGERSGKKLVPYLATSDIFCAPSIFGESFGMVILEAMASDLPVVAFANRGYKEFLKGKKAEKFLAKPKDFRELSQKIEILIKNPKLRKEIGKWGNREARKFSWQEIADQVLDFYDICEDARESKKEEEILPMDKFIDKLDKVLNKDILGWLK
jgi:phosphatidylinositol alpha-mannosyltransferase